MMCTIMKLSFIDTLLLLLCYILFASYCCMMTFPNVLDINLQELHQAMGTKEDAIEWCRVHGLLPRRKDCLVCGEEMSKGRGSK